RLALAQRLFGALALADVEQRPFEDGERAVRLLQEPFADQTPEHRAVGLAEADLDVVQGALHNIEIRFRKADGSVFWGLVSEGLLEEADGSLSILEGTLLDVSERKRTEEALRESEASILSLYNIASAQNLTFSDKAQAILELGCQRFGLEIGILARVQGERYEVVAVRSPDNAIVRGAVLELSDTYCRETLAARSTVSFEHAGASPRKAHPAYSSWGMESYLGAPVRAAGRIFGT